MAQADSPYYRRDLALVHHVGFGAHADACAAGILERLRPIRDGGGLVLEVGCGSGLLTRHLVAAGHRVVATDASPAMIALAREVLTGAEDIRLLALPDDPLPPADAIVSVGHVLSYLPDEAAIDRALVSIAKALRPGGVLAIDLCDLEYESVRRDAQPYCQVTDDWAIVTRFSIPSPTRFVRDMTTFVHAFDGSWRRDDERHVNVLIDTSRVPARLAEHGVRATVEAAFGGEMLPAGLRAIVGSRAEGGFPHTT
jgi:SAM-dependent methyltransferase